MPDLRREPDDVLDLDDDTTAAELQDQVQRAQAELTDLKRRAEQIERDKQRLEELSRKQDELESGRSEMVEKLTRSMAIIQRETGEAQKRLDQLQSIHESFLKHLRTLDSINPKQWIGGDLSKELSRALSLVDDARAEYGKARVKILPDHPEETVAATGAVGDYDEYDGAGGERGFLYWLAAGFAFTLPLIVTILAVALLLWLGGQAGH